MKEAQRKGSSGTLSIYKMEWLKDPSQRLGPEGHWE